MSDETQENMPPEPAAEVPVLGYARPGTQRPGMNLVTVATFAQAWEAHLACGKLEAEGIPAIIADENIVAIGGGIYTGMTGGIKLQVPSTDIERALAALPKRVRAQIHPCPKCHKIDTRQIELGPGMKILCLLMLGLPYLFIVRPYLCLDCGHIFRFDDDSEDEDEDDDEDENTTGSA